MKKKLIATVMAATMAVTALTGCGSSSASSAKKDIKVPTEPFGDTVKYDPSVEINDGKDISIDLWEWGSDELFQEIIDRYTAIHPNVTINLVDNPWDDYWTKLPLALDGENGPALFNVHNSYHENLINYMAPLDIPVEDLPAIMVGAPKGELTYDEQGFVKTAKQGEEYLVTYKQYQAQRRGLPLPTNFEILTPFTQVKVNINNVLRLN